MTQSDFEKRRAAAEAYFTRRMKPSQPLAQGWSHSELTPESVAASLRDYAFIRPAEGRLEWAMREGAVVILKQQAIIQQLRDELARASVMGDDAPAPA